MRISPGAFRDNDPVATTLPPDDDTREVGTRPAPQQRFKIGNDGTKAQPADGADKTSRKLPRHFRKPLCFCAIKMCSFTSGRGGSGEVFRNPMSYRVLS